jgi:hypothetical protein
MVYVQNKTSLTMNVTVPSSGIDPTIPVPRNSFYVYGPYMLDRQPNVTFTVFDSVPRVEGWGKCVNLGAINFTSDAVLVKITGAKFLPDGKRWIICSVKNIAKP